MVAMLGGDVAVNGDELRRVANQPEFRGLSEYAATVGAVADELKIQNPFDSR